MELNGLFSNEQHTCIDTIIEKIKANMYIFVLQNQLQ